MLTGTAVVSMATAAADPPPPPPADPGVAPPPQNLNDVLAPPVTAILGPAAPPGSGAPVDLLLSQYPAPSVPGSEPAQPMDPSSALSGNSFLLPQNYKLSPPDQGNMYSIAPGDVTDQPSLIPALKGAHALWHGGMGRLTPDQLGQPLPGTAPPPGTNIPAGPVDYLPDPLPWPQPVPPPPPPPAG
ncbi:MAG TPA: hypothetical protein VFB19_15960 [Mycobacterium sp.]|nr:hypothetical protein [Mycobacterium sp.]